MDINISHNERRSFFAFSGIYTTLLITVFTVLATLYYHLEKSRMLSEYQLQFQLQSGEILEALAMAPEDFENLEELDYYELYIGVYDVKRKRMFSNLHTSRVELNKNIYLNEGWIQYVTLIPSSEIGARFLVLESEDDGLWFQEYLVTLLVYALPLFLLLLALGVYLARLFIRPMQESVALLDSFIQESTHELNTPLTTILTNLELLSSEVTAPKSQKNMARAMSAAQTISDIYNTLVMVTLQKELKPQDEKVFIDEMIVERVAYFHTKIEAKELRVTMNLTPRTEVVMDSKLLCSLLDNLLSNAVKYNQLQGFINITLTSTFLSIENGGSKLPVTAYKNLFKPYVRLASSEGGFGLGLHIVSKIVEHYGFEITIQPLESRGTVVRVVF